MILAAIPTLVPALLVGELCFVLRFVEKIGCEINKNMN